MVNILLFTMKQLYSTLLFDPINYADDGEYTCQASNHIILPSSLVMIQ